MVSKILFYTYSSYKLLLLLLGQWGFWNTPSFLAGHMQDALTRTGGEIVQMVEDVKYIVSLDIKMFESL